MNAVAEASLLDMSTHPPAPADLNVIKVTSSIGFGNDPPPNNADASGLVSLVRPYGTLVMIEAASDAPITGQYKLTIGLVARDCAGRRIKKRECVAITVAECA